MKRKKTFTFGFIGTFSFWHGITVLEAIIPEILKQNKNVRFLLIGDGILREQLELSLSKQGVSETVIFTGAVSQEKAPEYLAQCDAFLCPTQPNSDGTRFFGSPTKLFEYMSMAKPIIASDLEQLAEVIDPAIRIKNVSKQETENFHVTNKVNEQKIETFSVTNEVGILVDSFDTQGFIDACLFCLNLSETDRVRMGNNARKKVLEQYTWQQHTKRIVDHAGL